MWTLFIDDDEPEKEKHSICPEGHIAVMCKKSLIDDIQVTFQPAVRVVDKIKKQVSLREKYYIVISDISMTWKKKSEKVYSWKEAVEFASNFDKRTVDWALKYWNRKSP